MGSKCGCGDNMNRVKQVKPIKYTPFVNSKKKVVKGQSRGVPKCLQGKKRNIVMKSGY